jgi:hypothetical protein
MSSPDYNSYCTWVRVPRQVLTKVPQLLVHVAGLDKCVATVGSRFDDGCMPPIPPPHTPRLHPYLQLMCQHNRAACQAAAPSAVYSLVLDSSLVRTVTAPSLLACSGKTKAQPTHLGTFIFQPALHAAE